VATVEDALLRLEASGWVLRGRFREESPAPVQWCERRLLARIHRLTLGILRREIEPVTAAAFVRWLLEWQHVTPGTQLHGGSGLLAVLEQLQGFEAPANVWEPQILARRVAGYDPVDLDRLCFGGVMGWGRLSPHPAFAAVVTEPPAPGPAPATARPAVGLTNRRIVPTSVAPISFFVREDAGWMLMRRDPQALHALSSNARDVLGAIEMRGASFFADILRETRRLSAEVEAALWELVAAGLVTADGFDNLRSLIDPRRRAGRGTGRHARPRQGTGRWATLPFADAGDRTQAVQAAAWMLLRRYGVVFRELLVRESNVPAWREVLVSLRRMEDRGEVRGGRFVAGFVGEQYALPEAVDLLRAHRHRQPAGQVVTVSAADPLNLVGVLVPGPRVPALSGRTVAYRDGVAIEAAEPAALRVG
jgi:ATP-dependent Lhr-like helicase